MGCSSSRHKNDADKNENEKNDIDKKLHEHTTSRWLAFLDENCTVARDKYVPVKIVTQAFTFYLENDEDFVKLWDDYKTRFVVNCVYHFVSKNIIELLKCQEGITLSKGFNVPPERRSPWFFHYNDFIDERTVIGLSVDHF